jgi:hypothetical protein
MTTPSLRLLAAALLASALAACSGTSPAQLTCDAPFVACGNACVMLDESAANCGACGVACAAAQSCVKGACYANECAGADCSASQVCPADRCVERACVGVVCPTGEACLNGTCVSSACGSRPCPDGWACVNNACEDVACFGVVCPANSVCQRGTCQASTCTDGRIGGDESDVDCGGSCPKCELGKVCGTGVDCASGECQGHVCALAPTCGNSVKDGTETDVDCGGGCRACADGRACTVASDCVSAECTAGRCTSSAQCADGVKNNSETDVDCGGSCPARCGTGKACLLPADCASTTCASNVCAQPATCVNGMKDGLETGVDCGGLACTARCADGGGCLVGGDCASGTCGANQLCAGPSCSDGRKNGLETGVDCGGPCTAKCPMGQGCNTGADCVDGVCQVGVCLGPSCVDGVANGTEGDVDCGGTCATKCVQGKRCNTGTDCVSMSCVANVCAADPTCADGVKNQGEVDVDCGGPNCGPCIDGKLCQVGSDCVHLFCLGTPAKCSSGYGTKDTYHTGITDGYGRVVTGRFTADAIDDAVVVTTSRAWLLTGASSGILGAPVQLPISVGSMEDLAVGDMNGDGKPDLVLAAGNSVHVLKSNGNGTFQAPISTVGSAVAGTVAVKLVDVGDFDKDGKLDVVASGTNFNGFYVSVLRGLGNGGFAAPLELITGITTSGTATLYDVAAGDFTGDGNLDAALVTNGPPAVVYLFLGSATGALTQQTMTYPATFPSFAMAHGRLDGDMREDLLVSSPTGYQMLFGAAAGFQPGLGVSKGANGGSLSINDLNGDGKLDITNCLYSASGGAPTVTLDLGDGLGGFNAGLSTVGGLGALGRHGVGDLNGDGRPDLVVSVNSSDSILVYLQR